jgi:transposase
MARLARDLREAVGEADARIGERCDELGIPQGFRPSIAMGWIRRGEEAASERVAELRRIAKAELSARDQAAKVEIERASLDVQTQPVAGGLRSDEARRYLDDMPTPDVLMPPLAVTEIETTLGEREGERPRYRRYLDLEP